MSTLNPPRHISKKHELREDQVVTFYAKAWTFFDQNRTLVYGMIGALVLVVVGIVGYFVYQQNRAEEAQRLLGQIVGQYEGGNYRQALDGAAGLPGLLEIADEYGSTPAGNLAHFYAADALFNLGEYDQALEHFEAYDGEDDLIGASAIAGQAAVYETREAFDRAGDLYRQAALSFENEVTSPTYLLDAARNYELAGEYAEAREAYELIQERFPESNQASGIDFYLARLDAMTQE